LFIFDEPTASLDALARQRFDARLRALDDTSTVIVCSHRLEEVQAFVGRVIELADGRVVRDLRYVAGGETSCAQGGL
jgi:energy-coupling factor transporter ATP-binding protein EcfA2